MKHPFVMIGDKFMPGKSDSFKKLVISTYSKVIFVIFFSSALFRLIKGIYYSILKKTPQKQNEFLEGSAVWGRSVENSTKTELKVLNEIEVPEKGHFIFINHVNEMDFPFDCKIIKKPFLANETIKDTLIAYWWMKAMGSEVFNKKDKRTIAKSVKNLLKGLKNQSYIVYPEGRNTYSEEIQSLKKGMINLAYKLNIPIYIVLKSGVTKYQENSLKNTIGYRSLGTVQPSSFDSWEELRDYLHDLMKREKEKLDSEITVNKISIKSEEEIPVNI